MKKLLVLILCLSSTMLFAQTLHFEIITAGTEAMQTTVTGVLMIDGVEEYNGEGMQDAGGGLLEIGVFDQDGICRGTKLPTWRSKSNQWIYQLKLRGYAGCTYPTFKVYDHATETEMDLVLNIEETIEWSANGKYGSTTNPYPINFTHEQSGETFTKEITGYGESTDKTGYYLIASPVAVDPTEVQGMTDGDYDLYAFNGSIETEEWRNYKAGEFTTLVPGTGYLYAKKDDIILTVTGTPATDNFDVTLDKYETLLGSINLVGNPYGVEAYIDRDCYTLNGEENYTLIEAGDPIPVMSGILVEATEDGEILSFYTTPIDKGASLSLNVTSESKLVDRAVVNFGSGRNLSKITFRENSTKVYLPQDTRDFAVVSTNNEGEMPVNFKAEENGNYTISFTAENVEFNYLHLIDNMTGNDVDLLETPSYSFDARTTDYASRFRLLFAKANAVMGDDFGFFDANGNLLILGIEGEANIQVIDVTGRVISNETFSGNYSKAVNAASGVYMLRLIQGNDVRTQKIIVK